MFLPLVLLLLIGPWGSGLLFYWQNTHQRLTMEALSDVSNLGPFLAQMGLEDVELPGGYVRLANCVKGVGIGDTSSAKSAVIAGAVLEDGVKCVAGDPLAGLFDWKRPNNHFEDRLGQPLTAAGLPLLNWPASEWGDDVAANHFTWKVAQDKYAEAVTARTETERTEALEVALVALGCNLHLLQDMFQPAHTRNDAHPGHELFLGEPVAGHSELEHHAGAKITPFTGFLPWDVPSPKRLPDRDLYFRDAIVFSHDHYFSDDTVFSEALPDLGGDVVTEEVPVCVTFAPGSGIPTATFARSTSQVTPGGHAAHLAREVPDPVSQILCGLSPTACWTLTDVPCTGTQRILDDNMAMLVPRAISYSAGLIDHFFRGRMSFEQGTDGSLTIVNDSHEITEPGLLIDVDFRQDPIEVPAEFVFLWEDADGNRTEFHREKLQSGGIPHGAGFTIPGFGDLVPGEALTGGSTRVAVLLERAHVGDDPSVVGGVFSWTTCSQVCRPKPIKLMPVGDVTGDGLDDLALWVMAELDQVDPALDTLTLLSGADCSEVWQRSGGQGYGYEAVGVGDVTGDGVGELVIQESYDSESMVFTMELRAGTGALLDTFTVVEFGKLSALGDVGGDGVADFLVRGAKVSVYSGTGAFLHTLFGIQANEIVSPAPDIDGDGGADLMVESLLGKSFRIVSTQTGAVLQQHTFDGASHFVALGDMNGDGTSDVAACLASTQTLQVYSGKTEKVLWSQPGLSFSVAPAGDFDGDGFADVSLRSFVLQSDPAKIVYTTAVASPKKKKVLLSFSPLGVIPGQPVRVGDLNDDTREDLVYPYATEMIGQGCAAVVLGSVP